MILTYGYIGIKGRGGQFFTWYKIFSDTIDSIRDDETDQPEQWPLEAYQNVRGIIRRNHKRVIKRRSDFPHMIGKRFVGY